MPDQIMLFQTAALSCGILDVLLASFSLIGNSGFLWLLTIVVLFCSKRTRRQAVMLFFAIALAYIIGDLILKELIMRDRPYIEFGITQLLIKPPSGYSFPSGHTASSFAAAAVLFSTNQKARIPVSVYALLISYSRVYVFAHFPTDVLAGALLGGACAYVVMAVFRRFAAPRLLYSIDVT